MYDLSRDQAIKREVGAAWDRPDLAAAIGQRVGQDFDAGLYQTDSPQFYFPSLVGQLADTASSPDPDVLRSWQECAALGARAIGIYNQTWRSDSSSITPGRTSSYAGLRTADLTCLGNKLKQTKDVSANDRKLSIPEDRLAIEATSNLSECIITASHTEPSMDPQPLRIDLCYVLDGGVHGSNTGWRISQRQQDCQSTINSLILSPLQAATVVAVLNAIEAA